MQRKVCVDQAFHVASPCLFVVSLSPPPGVPIHNIELVPGRGGQLARAASTSAVVTSKQDTHAVVRLPSSESARKVLPYILPARRLLARLLITPTVPVPGVLSQARRGSSTSAAAPRWAR